MHASKDFHSKSFSFLKYLQKKKNNKTEHALEYSYIPEWRSLHPHLGPTVPLIIKITSTKAATEKARIRHRINLLRQLSFFHRNESLNETDAFESSEHSVICLTRCFIGPVGS